MQSFKRCNELAAEIRDKFKEGKFQSGETLRVEKLERDFRTVIIGWSVATYDVFDFD